MFSIKHCRTKKITFIVCLVLLSLMVTSCNAPEDKVITSLGKYESYDCFTSGGFQDYTDYAKYYYDCAEVKGNQYFKQIQETDMPEINMHLDDFESWIETIKSNDPSNDVAANYDFERKIIDTEDYIYIDSEEHTWEDGQTSLTRYNIYLYDTQGQILYYFHNNI